MYHMILKTFNYIKYPVILGIGGYSTLYVYNKYTNYQTIKSEQMVMNHEMKMSSDELKNNYNELLKDFIAVQNKGQSEKYEKWKKIPKKYKTKEFYNYCLENNLLDNMYWETDQNIIANLLCLDKCTISELYGYYNKCIISFDTLKKYRGSKDAENVYIYGIENKHISLIYPGDINEKDITENIILTAIRTFTDKDNYSDWEYVNNYSPSYIMLCIPKNLRTLEFYIKVLQSIKPETIKYMDELTLIQIPAHILRDKQFIEELEKIYSVNPKIFKSSIQKYDVDLPTRITIYIAERDQGIIPLDGMYNLK